METMIDPVSIASATEKNMMLKRDVKNYLITW